MPDAPLPAYLEGRRGRGRNEYPIAVLWGTLLLTIALHHTSINSCLAELRRNSGLRLLIGIETPEAVPKAWNMSRFLKTLGEPECRALVLDAFATLLAAHRRTP